MNAITTMHELINAGFEQKQAEVLVSAIEQHSNDNHATKSDITELRAEFKTDLAELKTELKTEFKIDLTELKTEFKTDLAELKTELKSDIAKISERLNLLSWAVFSMGGTLLIGMAIIILTK